MQQLRFRGRSLRFSVLAAVALLAVPPAGARTTVLAFRSVSRAANPYIAKHSLSQEGGVSEEEAAIPAEQVDKYIAVYGAMQRDHSLTVDRAAARQGLTVTAFRDLESRIERNPVAHERVLKALSEAAKRHLKNTAPADETK